MAKAKKNAQQKGGEGEEKTEEQLRAEGERKAREANASRNARAVSKLDQIADSADQIKNEEDDLEPLTDEVWDQGDPDNSSRRTRAEQLEDQEADEAEEQAERLRQSRNTEEDEDEDEGTVIARAEQQDRDADDARDAGAEDSRRGKSGQIEYKLVINGKEKWLTLAQLRATAGKVESADEYLQGAKRGATRSGNPEDSPDAAEAQRQAEEQAKAQAAAYKARLKDLYTKASMGDETAIDELAEIQSGLSRVTPDVLRIVDERVDARVTGRTEFERAVEWFEGEYEHELSTPTLKAFAARRDRELAQADPDRPVKDRLQAVGNELRQLRKDLGGQVTNTRPTKQQRKEAMPQVPAAAGRPRQAEEGDEGESTQDAIRAMARSRGQARAIKH